MNKSSKKKFYTVWAGRIPGVYRSWEECQDQVNGFENAVYKAFPSEEEAEDAFKHASKDYIGVNQRQTNLNTSELLSIGKPIENSICVDGAWNTVTNVTEYQGVIYPQNSKLFHAGPFSAGTNNIAEFLAIVHALTICQNNPSFKVIYSDSKTAISWIKNRKAATKIAHTDANNQIIAILRRAEEWLIKNTYQVPVLKWETAAWGENPADFGRK